MTNLSQIADELGTVKAAIAELAKKESALKDVILASGQSLVEGALFRVAVSHTERETLDMAAVREKLSPQFIVAHTKVTETVTVRVSSRKGA